MAITAQERFIEGAHQHGVYTIEGDAKATNSAYNKLRLALKELRETPDRGERFFGSLINNDDLSVVTWAALYLLPYKPDEAVQALQMVADEGESLIAFDAAMTLKEWRAGRLLVD